VPGDDRPELLLEAGGGVLVYHPVQSLTRVRDRVPQPPPAIDLDGRPRM
jgi:hypothetical protein